MRTMLSIFPDGHAAGIRTWSAARRYSPARVLLPRRWPNKSCERQAADLPMLPRRDNADDCILGDKPRPRRTARGLDQLRDDDPHPVGRPAFARDGAALDAVVRPASGYGCRARGSR